MRCDVELRVALKQLNEALTDYADVCAEDAYAKLFRHELCDYLRLRVFA
jgi:hypothetical protein